MFFNPSKVIPLLLHHLIHLVPVLYSKKSESGALLASNVCQCVGQHGTCPHLQPENRAIGERGKIFYGQAAATPQQQIRL